MPTFREVLGCVCKRPAMYVGRADFALAAAFLNGYDFALSDRFPDLEQSGLAGFTVWLSVRLDSCRKSPWDEIIVREDVGPDKFDALVRLYDEFDHDREIRGLEAIRKEYERLCWIIRDRTCWCEGLPENDRVDA